MEDRLKERKKEWYKRKLEARQERRPNEQGIDEKISRIWDGSGLEMIGTKGGGG